jgi:N-acetylmuramic acid 6-phosphate etherase
MQHELDLSSLATEQINPASIDFDTLPTERMLAIINDEDKKVALAVEKELPRIASAVDAIVEVLLNGGRLYYTGAGTSGRLGVLDASECPPTFNVQPEMVQGLIAGGDYALRNAVEGAEDSFAKGQAELEAAGFTKDDILCGIAASGRTPYVLGSIEFARTVGAATIGLACVPDSEIGAAADYPIEPFPGPEVVSGSTRMKAGTATKLVLNMLTTGTMVKMGYVYSNLMVNVQPRNEKLIDRAQRIIMAVARVDRGVAARAFEASGRDVRIAAVMARMNVCRDEAMEKLAAAGGRLRAVFGELDH